MKTFYTAQMLREEGARCPEVAIFKEEWPDGAALTKANLLKAAELGLNLWWWAHHFLPASLWDEFERQDALLWDGFKRQVDSLQTEYECQEALLIWRLICKEKEANARHQE